MNFSQLLQTLIASIQGLDKNKKIALFAALGLFVVGGIAMSVVANTPATVPLYTNVERDDLNRMSRVLSENGIDFVASGDKGTIGVHASKLASARMILAEVGLPSGEKTGYELFDGVNSLGLTSFMQNVTNKRAIEGELTRTIAMIRGIHSSRVHLVMPNTNGFRRNSQDVATASVVLKSYGSLPEKTTLAIRHMVAAAVRGLESNNVTIIGADGTLLQSVGDQFSGGVSSLIDLENTFSMNIENKITSAVGPHLGLDNFRVTVTAKLNSDKRRTDETVFDPESRIERSVQIVKELGNTENRESTKAATITQNLPDETEGDSGGQTSKENSERREELTNYEINQKKTSIVSDGYQIEKLSVALVVNRERVVASLGENPDEAAIAAKIAELEGLIQAAIGFSEERGDTVKVSLVEFLPGELASVGDSAGNSTSFLSMHFGSIMNALGLIVGMLVLALLGVRPLIKFLSPPKVAAAGGGGIDDAFGDDTLLGGGGDFSPAGALPGGNMDFSTNLGGGMLGDGGGIGDPMADLSRMDGPEITGDNFNISDIEERETKLKDQLAEIVDQNDERAAYVIRQWLQGDTLKTV
ncbi:MAG: flagellar M-ring protein FliF [Rhizobiaceae bacterium]|nr:flagellar M-ring protein FliF [Rhizobiaceae bacterium]